MAELYRCAKCGNVLSDTLGGHCPGCLLQEGLAESSAGPPGRDTEAYQSRPAENAPEGGTVLKTVLPCRTDELPSPGQDFGAYHIVRALGRGGMGSVFEAEELDSGRRLALKVLNHSLDSPGARQRFLREGRLAASVNHPQSVYVFGTEEIQGAPVITMELVQGGTLQDRVRGHGPLPIQEAVDAVLQIVDGLEAAQAVGVLHRDIKPANCFVDGEGRVKIGDFGLSISTVGRGDLHLTSSGAFLGTPAFASPEQLRGDELDQRSDLYAVGVTLFYLLTGKVPFEADTMIHLVAKVLEKPAPDVRALRFEVPRALAAVIQCCLAKEPNRRYRSYADLRSALLPFGSRLPSPASPSRRFIAGCIDFAVLFTLTAPFALLLEWFGIKMSYQGEWSQRLLMFSSGLGWGFVYYILPEGFAGATLGKRLLGMRVVRQGQRQPPGFWRASVRTLIFQWLPALPFGLYSLANADLLGEDGQLNLTGSSMAWGMAAGLGYYALFGLLFVTMRRSNGFAGLHELCSGTRVIVRPTATQRPLLPKPQESSEEIKPAALTIGPYHVLANLGSTAGGEWHLGYDPRLFRKVWLCVVPTGTPRMAAAWQNLARPGRLRWLAGRRGSQENWDAFEAPTGQALWQLLDRSQDWSHVGYWLLDLSEELASALKDGTLPPALGLECVWITADGRAMLLDQGIPGLEVSTSASISTQPGDVEPVKGFLQQVAVAALHGRRVSFGEAQLDTFALPLPLYVRPIVEGLKKVQRPEVAAAQIQSALAKPTRVSKTRRAAILACCAGIPLLLTLSIFAQTALFASTMGGTPELIDLQNALQWHSPIIAWDTEPSDEERKALEIYVAGTHRDLINEPATWTNGYMTRHVLPQQHKAAKEILARTPPPTEQELQKARAVVGPHLDYLKDRAGGLDSFKPALFLPLMFTMTLAMYIAFPSVLWALLFRGGLLWRLFGITAVTKNGQPAGRWRLCARNLIVWSPLLIFPIGLSMLVALVNEPGMPGAFLVMAYAALVFLGMAYAALVLASTFTNQRGWPDRLAGTWLVIR
jgi:eukaryotic-like serine/threonine-protein kinase